MGSIPAEGIGFGRLMNCYEIFERLLFDYCLLKDTFSEKFHVEQFGPLAQLVERYIRIVEVGGSTPPRSTKHSQAFGLLHSSPQ